MRSYIAAEMRHSMNLFSSSFFFRRNLCFPFITRRRKNHFRKRRRHRPEEMLSSLLSGLMSGLPTGNAAAPLAEAESEEATTTTAKALPQQQQPRRRRASGSFSGDASAPSSSSSSSASSRRRPLVIEWPQVKAFLAMADASLRRKTEQVEVRERGGGVLESWGKKKEEEKDEARLKTKEKKALVVCCFLGQFSTQQAHRWTLHGL